MRHKRILAAVSGTVAAGLFGAAAYAATETVAVDVEFVTPVTINVNSAMMFGLLDEALANAETVAVSTADVVSDPSSRVLGGTQAAADLTIGAVGVQPINILVDNISNGTGYSLGSFVCDYNGDGSAACDQAGGLSTTSAAGGTATLFIGATLTGDGNAVPGAADGSFDVTVIYE